MKGITQDVYWLLLHFEDPRPIKNSRECLQLLKKYLINYEKNIDPHKIKELQVKRAIKRAKQRDNPPTNNWPLKHGSTLYKLVEKILE